MKTLREALDGLGVGWQRLDGADYLERAGIVDSLVSEQAFMVGAKGDLFVHCGGQAIIGISIHDPKDAYESYDGTTKFHQRGTTVYLVADDYEGQGWDAKMREVRATADAEKRMAGFPYGSRPTTKLRLVISG